MISTKTCFALVGLWLTPALLIAQTNSDYAVDQTTGLRMERYRAPVPADIPDAITLTNTTAIALHEQQDAVFIDVYPPKGLGPDPLDGHWVTNEERQTIPGSVWLPEVGRGSLQPDALDYFSRNLQRLSKGNTSAVLVFFCTADCWQSWNAARRATTLGYTGIHWYPLGTDGWLESGLSLTRAYPVNFIDDTIDTPETDPSRQ